MRDTNGDLLAVWGATQVEAQASQAYRLGFSHGHSLVMDLKAMLIAGVGSG